MHKSEDRRKEGSSAQVNQPENRRVSQVSLFNMVLQANLKSDRECAYLHITLNVEPILKKSDDQF